MDNLLKNTNLLIIIGVIVIVVLVITILAIRTNNKNKRLKQLDLEQDRISVLKALPVQYLLNKVSLMPKTPDIEVSYQEWKDVYNKLIDEDHKNLNVLTSEIDDLIYARKYSLATTKLKELSVMITKYENEYEELLDDLTKATQVDVKNREEITNQKELFRNYKKMYNSNLNNYKPFNNAIERYLEDIENSFTNIDILLNQSEVDKALNRAASLEGDLLKMKDILNNLPVILEDLTKDLPLVLTEVEHKYNNLIRKKFNILSLDIPNRLAIVRKQILGSLSKNQDVFIKDLQDSVSVVDIELRKMIEDLEYEEKASEQIEKLINKLVSLTHDANKKA
ncbi:MAG: septation ring formation regulator EzrA, partial [Bacilli bacterium]